jgi:predicted O-linked N-acetylglucosamine transferase (SPINDLY family)
MGVPVIHALGDRATSRFSASILTAIGRPEWIAMSEEEYVDKAAELARDVERRRTLRATQRKRMADSALCNARDLAEHLENAYFAMFERSQAKRLRKTLHTCA